MKRLGCKAVPLSKEPMGLPVSEDVDTRGTASNIEDTNTAHAWQGGEENGVVGGKGRTVTANVQPRRNLTSC